MSDQTYTIAELLALPDERLNALAAELRGYKLVETVWDSAYENGSGDSIPVTEWTPATDRNQSGELLTLATAQGLGFMVDWFGVGDTPARISCYQQADCAWLCEIPGNDARAETVAFCAAMLAMAVTVDDCSTGAQCCPFLR